MDHGTLSSDGFDVNNRTMEASSRSGTIQKVAQMMPQNPHTEYDKPWYKETRKEYLKDAKEITISFERENENKELPSKVQYMKPVSQNANYKYEISMDRDDFGSEFDSTNGSGIGEIIVGLGSSSKHNKMKENGPQEPMNRFEGSIVDMRDETSRLKQKMKEQD